MASTTILTYVSNQASNILNNRSFTYQRKIVHTSDRVNFFAKQITPSMGILGDVFSGEYNRYDGSLWDSYFGPVMGNIADTYKMWQQIRNGQSPVKSLKYLGKNNIPMINILGSLGAVKLLYLKALSNHIDYNAWNKSVRTMRDKYGEEPLITP